MKLIFKSMVSLLVLANLAGAAADEERRDAASASNSVYALPYRAADDLLREVALNAGRVEQQIGALVLAATENPRIAELTEMLTRAKEKLALRQGQWEELKGRISTVREEVAAIDDTYISSITREQEGKALPSLEAFLNLFDRYVQGKQIYDEDKVVGLSDEVSRTRHNISGLTEILSELETEVISLTAKK